MEEIILETQDRDDFWNGCVRNPVDPRPNEANVTGENDKFFYEFQEIVIIVYRK